MRDRDKKTMPLNMDDFEDRKDRLRRVGMGFVEPLAYKRAEKSTTTSPSLRSDYRSELTKESKTNDAIAITHEHDHSTLPSLKTKESENLISFQDSIRHSQDCHENTAIEVGSPVVSPKRTSCAIRPTTPPASRIPVLSRSPPKPPHHHHHTNEHRRAIGEALLDHGMSSRSLKNCSSCSPPKLSNISANLLRTGPTETRASDGGSRCTLGSAPARLGRPSKVGENSSRMNLTSDFAIFKEASEMTLSAADNEMKPEILEGKRTLNLAESRLSPEDGEGSYDSIEFKVNPRPITTARQPLICGAFPIDNASKTASISKAVSTSSSAELSLVGVADLERELNELTRPDEAEQHPVARFVFHEPEKLASKLGAAYEMSEAGLEWTGDLHALSSNCNIEKSHDISQNQQSSGVEARGNHRDMRQNHNDSHANARAKAGKSATEKVEILTDIGAVMPKRSDGLASQNDTASVDLLRVDTANAENFKKLKQGDVRAVDQTQPQQIKCGDGIGSMSLSKKNIILMHRLQLRSKNRLISGDYNLRRRFRKQPKLSKPRRTEEVEDRRSLTGIAREPEVNAILEGRQAAMHCDDSVKTGEVVKGNESGSKYFKHRSSSQLTQDAEADKDQPQEPRGNAVRKHNLTHIQSAVLGCSYCRGKGHSAEHCFVRRQDIDLDEGSRRYVSSGKARWTVQLDFGDRAGSSSSSSSNNIKKTKEVDLASLSKWELMEIIVEQQRRGAEREREVSGKRRATELEAETRATSTTDETREIVEAKDGIIEALRTEARMLERTSRELAAELERVRKRESELVGVILEEQRAEREGDGEEVRDGEGCRVM